jgi:hypothetical protein
MIVGLCETVPELLTMTVEMYSRAADPMASIDGF